MFAPIPSNFVDPLFSKFKPVAKQYNPNINKLVDPMFF